MSYCEYTPEIMEEADAVPGYILDYPHCGMNPHEKFTYHESIGRNDKAHFGFICDQGAAQLVWCYRNFDKYISPYQFMDACDDCPHCMTKRVEYCGKQSWYADNQDYSGREAAGLISKHIDPFNPKSFVYFITDGVFTKIGKADDVEKRLGSLQTGNPRPLTVQFVIPCCSSLASSQIEKFLHGVYASRRQTGEWFVLPEHDYSELQAEINGYIESLKKEMRKLEKEAV